MRISLLRPSTCRLSASKVASPRAGELQRVLAQRMAEDGTLPALAEGLKRARPRNLRLELEAILRELFAVMHRNRHALQLIDRCGGDHPDLPRGVQREVREGTQSRLARYLTRRSGSRALRPMADPFLVARVALETLTTWSVHIGWDPVPQHFDPKLAEDAVIAFILGGLLRDRST